MSSQNTTVAYLPFVLVLISFQNRVLISRVAMFQSIHFFIFIQTILFIQKYFTHYYKRFAKFTTTKYCCINYSKKVLQKLQQKCRAIYNNTVL